MEKEASWIIMSFDAIQSLEDRILPYVSYTSIGHCEGYGFQGVQSDIG